MDLFFRREVLAGGAEGWAGSCRGWFWCFDERHCDLLDVLGGCSQQALAGDTGETSEAGIAVAMQLLGIGKGALDRFLAAFVDRLAPSGQAVGIGALAGVGQTWRVMVRVAVALWVQEASNGQVRQMAGSDA